MGVQRLFLCGCEIIYRLCAVVLVNSRKVTEDCRIRNPTYIKYSKQNRIIFLYSRILIIFLIIIIEVLEEKQALSMIDFSTNQSRHVWSMRALSSLNVKVTTVSHFRPLQTPPFYTNKVFHPLQVNGCAARGRAQGTAGVRGSS